MRNFLKIGFFLWLVKTYGYTVCKTYQEIETDCVHQINYVTIRSYLLCLAKVGYISVKNKGTHHREYHINVEAYKKLFANG